MKSRSRIILLHLCLLLILAFAIGLASIILINKYQATREMKQQYTDKIQYYESIITIECNWIRGNQVSNGALLFRKSAQGESDIVPYFSNTAALALLSGRSGLDYSENVREYMNWYLQHLNTAETDPVNGDGSIYNYKISHADQSVISEVSSGRYDSVDSYAASFITLLRGYYERTGDSEYLISNRNDIQRVMRAMLGTIDLDGLSMTNNESRVKYMMDNAEVNRGLRDALFIMEEVFLVDLPASRQETDAQNDLNEKMKDALSKNTGAIENLLWNSKEIRYEIGIGKNDKVLSFKGWDLFYPDATAQLFPISMGIVDPGTKRAELLYGDFCDEYDWENFGPLHDGDTNHYWCFLAYSGALMGDVKRVDQFLHTYQNEVIALHNDPMYIGDSGWCVMACDEMISLYEAKIARIDPYGIVTAE